MKILVVSSKRGSHYLRSAIDNFFIVKNIDDITENNYFQVVFFNTWTLLNHEESKVLTDQISTQLPDRYEIFEVWKSPSIERLKLVNTFEYFGIPRESISNSYNNIDYLIIIGNTNSRNISPTQIPWL